MKFSTLGLTFEIFFAIVKNNKRDRYVQIRFPPFGGFFLYTNRITIKDKACHQLIYHGGSK